MAKKGVSVTASVAGLAGFQSNISLWPPSCTRFKCFKPVSSRIKMSVVSPIPRNQTWCFGRPIRERDLRVGLPSPVISHVLACSWTTLGPEHHQGLKRPLRALSLTIKDGHKKPHLAMDATCLWLRDCISKGAVEQRIPTSLINCSQN